MKPPVHDWERYEIIDFIGEGGMGRVFKARDPRLDRRVALKFITGDSADQEKRLLHEAMLHARVEHPNVCEVYEVGEVEDKPYIAMRFIDGATLKEAFQEMSLEERIETMIKVARAVDAAHRVGLIHRDVKPANIMVEKHDDHWFPFVMDFGLSREMAAPGLTQTGIIVGTPNYVAPEQAQGLVTELDHRADIYSLGATLYELAVGRVPFEGDTSIDVIMKVLHKDPSPPRRLAPLIPADLETIILKAMEKEPERRYASAAEFADDLQRLLDGDAIRARPAGFVYRTVKRIRKQKALWSLAALLVAVLIAASAFLLHNRAQYRLREELTREFDQHIAYVEGRLRHAYTSDLHDVRADEADLEGRLEAIRARMDEVGAAADGPGHAALGRCLLALNRPREAREHLETAWNSGFDSPQVAYALGLSLGELFQDELSALKTIKDRSLREQRQHAIESELRDPALDFLRKSGGIGTDAPEYAEGLIALYEGDIDRALERSKAALGRIPWLYEAHLLAAQAERARVRELRQSGPTEAIDEAQRREGIALEAALATGRSDPRVHGALCEHASRAVAIEYYDHKADPRPLVDDVDRLCSRALEVRPDDARIFSDEADAWIVCAEYASEYGGEPEPDLERATEFAERAAELAPDDVRPHYQLGMIAFRRLYVEARRGVDLGPLLEAAIEPLARATEINPDYSPALNVLGACYLELGKRAITRGEESRQALLKAVDAYERAIELTPNQAKLHNNLGYANRFLGQRCLYTGEDPTPFFEKAAACHERAIELKPDLSVAHAGLGSVYRMWATWADEYGGVDPAPLFEKAIAAFDEAVRLNPGLGWQYVNLANAHMCYGQHKETQGEDPTESYRRAIENHEKARELNPAELLAHNNIGLAQVSLASYQADHDQDPTDALNAARAALEKTLEINPTWADAYRLLGDVDGCWARWVKRNGEDPRPYYHSNLENIDKALELNPANHLIGYDAAGVWLKLATWESEHGIDPEKAIANGLDRIGQSLELNDAYPAAYVVRGKLLLLRSKTSGSADEARGALVDFEKARELKPELEAELAPLIAEAESAAAADNTN